MEHTEPSAQHAPTPPAVNYHPGQKIKYTHNGKLMEGVVTRHVGHELFFRENGQTTGETLVPKDAKVSLA